MFLRLRNNFPVKKFRLIFFAVSICSVTDLVFSAEYSISSNRFDCMIEPNQSVEIRSPVVGLLETVAVHRGDKVRKGQVIAALEQRAERASTELSRYKSEMAGPVRATEVKLEFAKRKFERRRDMKAEKFMSAQESDDAEVEMQLAAAEVQQAKENKQLAKFEWEQQRALLNLRTLLSPFDGVVVDQLLFPGEVVEPSADKKPILKLAQLDPLLVHVILPFSVFGQVKTDMRVEVYPEPPVGGAYKGGVKIIDKLVDGASGTFGVFLELSNSSLYIPAGIRCSAGFPFGSTGRTAGK